MALYVISWLDKPDSFELRAATRDAHLTHVARHADQVRLGGPFLDDEGRMIGSLLIFEGDSLADAQAFHDADPYKQAGLFESSSVRPWRITVGGLLPLRATGS